MARVHVEETLLREPNLWVPGNKPVGPVKIDWTNQLTQGLEYVQLFRHPQDNDLVGNLTPTVVDFTYAGSEKGMTMTTTDASGDYFDSGYNTKYVDGDWISLFAIVRMNAAAGTLAAQRDGTPAQWQLWSDDTNINWRGGSLSVSVTANILNQWLTIGVTAHLQNIGTETGHLYVDGTKIGNDIVSCGTVSTDAIPLAIGSRWSGYPTTAYEADMDIAFFAMWKNTPTSGLTAEQHLSMSLDPYQFLIPG